jgi:hypothetical protein
MEIKLYSYSAFTYYKDLSGTYRGMPHDGVLREDAFPIKTVRELKCDGAVLPRLRTVKEVTLSPTGCWTQEDDLLCMRSPDGNQPGLHSIEVS